VYPSFHAGYLTWLTRHTLHLCFACMSWSHWFDAGQLSRVTVGVISSRDPQCVVDFQRCGSVDFQRCGSPFTYRRGEAPAALDPACFVNPPCPLFLLYGLKRPMLSSPPQTRRKYNGIDRIESNRIDRRYDARLFNQSAGMDSGFGADDGYGVYSKPMFNRGEAQSVYKPKTDDGDAWGDADQQMSQLTGTERFRADRGFKVCLACC